MPTNINGNTGIDKVQDGTVVSADIDTLDASKLTGSIAAARIASNTIDSAHIASGAVDDAHISGIAATKLTGALPAISAANLTAIPAANITGTLPAISGASLTGLPAPTTAQMPAGSLLQVATDYDGDIINMSNSSWNTTNLSIAFTPKRADSKIIVTAHLNLFMAGGGSQHGSAQAQIYKDSSAFGELLWVWCGYGGTEAQLAQASPITVEEVSGSTSARTYSVQVRNYQTQAGSTFNPYTGQSALIVMEIAV
jgi:hypothetical protein